MDATTLVFIGISYVLGFASGAGGIIAAVVIYLKRKTNRLVQFGAGLAQRANEPVEAKTDDEGNLIVEES